MALAVCGEQDGKGEAAAAGGIFAQVKQGDVVETVAVTRFCLCCDG